MVNIFKKMKQFIKFKDSITKYFTKIWWILQGGFISIWGMLGILNKPLIPQHILLEINLKY